ncbi:tRNA (uracil-5-)-methyltransferase [Ophiocordyceps sinensis CO18]|uniref:Trimethylguanosine synthase n=1 Tax=Ophiocordyceps sinensis (strain Co18 / CGMCC 3.14243) TaxID=911162 RepID=T5A9I9_OPHSC|nr:tRNA (uracil-5-)-methyltransferase [Ophiocordyceps sinensis CO18]
MKRERARIQSSFASFKRGATLLLRENTRRYLADDCDAAPGQDKVSPHKIRSEGDGFVDVKSCETNSRATTTEYVGDHVFTNPAGSFFQNNNAILPVFTAYVKDHILPPVRPGEPAIGYLIHAYSGAGLFTVALASVFRHSTGIDVAADSIASARRNAALNGLGDDRCLFIAADASQLFGNVSYPPDETLVVLDPPRKGCDADFLAQLSAFGPQGGRASWMRARRAASWARARSRGWRGRLSPREPRWLRFLPPDGTRRGRRHPQQARRPVRRHREAKGAMTGLSHTPEYIEPMPKDTPSSCHFLRLLAWSCVCWSLEG